MVWSERDAIKSKSTCHLHADIRSHNYQVKDHLLIYWMSVFFSSVVRICALICVYYPHMMEFHHLIHMCGVFGQRAWPFACRISEYKLLDRIFIAQTQPRFSRIQHAYAACGKSIFIFSPFDYLGKKQLCGWSINFPVPANKLLCECARTARPSPFPPHRRCAWLDATCYTHSAARFVYFGHDIAIGVCVCAPSLTAYAYTANAPCAIYLHIDRESRNWKSKAYIYIYMLLHHHGNRTHGNRTPLARLDQNTELVLGGGSQCKIVLGDGYVASNGLTQFVRLTHLHLYLLAQHCVCVVCGGGRRSAAVRAIKHAHCLFI